MSLTKACMEPTNSWLLHLFDTKCTQLKHAIRVTVLSFRACAVGVMHSMAPTCEIPFPEP
jgi:hypothetical protein